ncbi:MAG: hypothetical protein CVT83_00670 [Alphaproteobacteria bacterium HGW-Alphaproteobacteria-5]|nr:MAG: hypothetical protein CVT83_00670 [Alphaproteobacteria bacterium HGW-Alphaproteobacteria-5]
MFIQRRDASRPQLLPMDQPGSSRPVLTRHDYGRLETSTHERHEPASRMQTRIQAKLTDARVVPGSQIPETVVTLGSIVRYRVDGDRIERRMLQFDREPAPNGQYVCVFTPVGLALLGQSQGDTVETTTFDGRPLRIVIGSVEFQPESDTRRRDSIYRDDSPLDGGGPEAA